MSLILLKPYKIINFPITLDNHPTIDLFLTYVSWSKLVLGFDKVAFIIYL